MSEPVFEDPHDFNHGESDPYVEGQELAADKAIHCEFKLNVKTTEFNDVLPVEEQVGSYQFGWCDTRQEVHELINQMFDAIDRHAKDSFFILKA